MTIYVGAIMGALFAAYGRTMLFDSVEAEVNGAAAAHRHQHVARVVWAQSKDPSATGFFCSITYLAFLGIGIHMYYDDRAGAHVPVRGAC